MDHAATALRFITCGSVDDGKSTLIGSLLLDSRTLLQDQLASVSRSGSVDLAQFTDGLLAEREQGITIDVASRYFSTARRKFTRNLDTLIAWLDDEPLVPGRIYWALHGHRWVKARVERILHQLNIFTLAQEANVCLPANAIGQVQPSLQEPLATRPFVQ